MFSTLLLSSLLFNSFVLSEFITYNNNIECVTETNQGNPDPAYSGLGYYISPKSCSGGYELVGCAGYNPWRGYTGTYSPIGTTNRCNGHTMFGSPWLQTQARCCNNIQASFETKRSSVSSSNDDSTTSISCNDVLVGCFDEAKSRNENTRDGSYPGDRYSNSNNIKKCTAQNGNDGDGIYAVARCANFNNNDYKLECKSVWGPLSNGNDDATSSISCPNNYFLTGCTSYSIYKYLDGSYYSNDGNTCVAVNGNGGGGVRAIGTCCQQQRNWRGRIALFANGGYKGTAYKHGFWNDYTELSSNNGDFSDNSITSYKLFCADDYKCTVTLCDDPNCNSNSWVGTVSCSAGGKYQKRRIGKANNNKLSKVKIQCTKV